MSVIYARNGIFYTDVIVDGRRVRTSLKTRDRNEALRRLPGTLVQQGAAKAAGMTVGQMLDRVYREVWSQKADQKKEGLCRLVTSTIGADTPVATLDRSALKAYQDRLRTAGLKPATINRYLACLLAAMRHARAEWDPTLPLPETRQLRLREPPGRTRYLSTTERAQLLQSEPDEHWRAFWMFLLDAGCRLSDGLKASWDQFDWEHGLWRNPNSKAKGAAVSIPLSGETISLLQARRSSGLWRPFPWTPAGAIRHFAHTREKAGLGTDVTIHILRHTCATTLLSNGADIREVQQWLGHSTIEVTTKYAKVIPKRLLELRAKIDNATM